MTEYTAVATAAQSEDWDAAFASMVPSAEDVAQEQAYYEQLAHQQDYEAWLDARAAQLAAEEAAADQEAAEAAAARPGANYRSTRDGLTREERSRLRLPHRYHVEEVSPGQWWGSHREVEAILAVRKLDTQGTVEVISNTGAPYTVNVLNRTCPCEWHARHPAEACKHLAAATAVADFRAKERARVAAAVEARFERNWQRLDAYIERQRTGRRLAA